jgi:DNA polymerase-1
MNTVLIDGSNIVMRGIKAMAKSPLSAAGVSTGPLLVFINALSKVVREEQPQHLMVAWDGGRSPRRMALYPDYKSNRRAPSTDEHDIQDGTYMLVKEFLTLVGAHHQSRPQVEADDIIADAWRGSPGPGGPEDKLVILSNDHDFEQLLGPTPSGLNTELIRVSSANTPTDRWSFERLIMEKGYRPDQAALIQALAGDSSDGIPGLPGIGPKRAFKLLEANDWDLGKVAEAKPEHADDIEVFSELVNLRSIRLDPPVIVGPWAPPRVGGMFWGNLLAFLDHYEMHGVKERLLSGVLWSRPSQPSKRPGRRVSFS